jgi:LacI family transcriptional regulator
LSRLKKWGANGIIAPDAKENKQLIQMGVPTIVYRMTRKATPGLPAVIADNASVGEMVAEHLLELGFRNFAYCGINGRPWSKERSESFNKRIEEAGSETSFFNRASRLHGPHSFETEQARMVDWVKSLPMPVGLMAGNDDCGGHVMEACKIAGLSVPDKVAVLGVDNDEFICELTDPPLSSVAFNTEKAGYEVAELLDKLMTRKQKMTGQRVTVRPTHIVTRQSSDILAIEDNDVVMAIRFIRQHAKEVIGVDDVVDTTKALP